MAVHNFNRVLQWSDFAEVAVPRKPRLDAEVHSGFAVTFRGRDKRPNGMPVFRPSGLVASVELQFGRSWVLRGRTSPELLRHEQGHFDISAVAARQCHDDILRIEAATERGLLAAFNKLVDDTHELMKQIQEVYDSTCGTAHGTNPVQQREWLLRIAAAKTNPNGRLSALATCLPPVLPVVFFMASRII